MNYEIYDEDTRTVRTEGKGLPHEQCLQQGVNLITKGAVKGTDQELLTWLYQNHFDIRPRTGGKNKS